MPEFESYYRGVVSPLLAARESERLAAVARLRQFQLGGGGLAALIAGIGLVQFDGDSLAWILAGAGYLVPYAIGRSRVHQVGLQAKDDMLGAIAAYAGVSFARQAPQPIPISDFQSRSLVPNFDRSTYEDWLEGERSGAKFTLFEAHLEVEHRDKDGDTSYSTAFRGQLLRIAFPRKFLGETLVLRDAGLFNSLRRPGRDLQRIGLADPKFEAIFEVYGSDQVEARYLVDPAFMERLLKLEASLKGKKARAAFAQGELLVAVEGGNLFEVGSLFTPLDDPARARAVLNDIEAIGELIETLLARGPRPD